MARPWDGGDNSRLEDQLTKPKTLAQQMREKSRVASASKKKQAKDLAERVFESSLKYIEVAAENGNYSVKIDILSSDLPVKHIQPQSFLEIEVKNIFRSNGFRITIDYGDLNISWHTF